MTVISEDSTTYNTEQSPVLIQPKSALSDSHLHPTSLSIIGRFELQRDANKRCYGRSKCEAGISRTGMKEEVT